VFHVTTHEGKWIVRQEGRPDGEYDSFETKEEAVQRGRHLAQQHEPGQVKIHRTDGTFEDEFTYGADPDPPPG
jgi:hypothetical protein